MADLLDVLTLAEAKTALNLTGTGTFDAELVAWITAVSRRLDRAVGPIVERTVTGELHDGGCGAVRTEFWPVKTLTTVTEYQDTTPVVLTRETNAVKPADGYLALPYFADPTLFSGRLRRRSSGTFAWFACGAQNIELTYDAGRYDTTATVDEPFKTGARLFLEHLWNAQRPNVGAVGEFDVPQSNWPRFAIPNAVHELLVDFWQEPKVLVA